MPISLHTDFGGGNGRLVELRPGPDGTDIRFAVEFRNGPEGLWFHFRLDGLADHSGQRVRVVLANPHQTLGGPDWSTNSPVCRPVDGSWQRLGPPEEVQTLTGRQEWAWTLQTGEADSVEVAACFPYQPDDLAATLGNAGEAFTTEFVGLTMLGRPLELVCTGPAKADMPLAILTARHHAGETPGSWVLDGLLRRLANDPDARNAATWWALPMVNLDDVVAGNYGKDPAPHDCNRGYGNVRRPESGAVMETVWRAKSAAATVLLADLHAPSHRERSNYIPTRGWSQDTIDNPLAIPFAERLQANTPQDIRSPKAYVTPPGNAQSRQPGQSCARWCMESAGIDAVTIENSYQGNEQRDYTIDDYRRIGSALVDTILSWFADRPG